MGMFDFVGDVLGDITGTTSAAEAASAGQLAAGAASAEGLKQQQDWIASRTTEGVRQAYGQQRGADIRMQALEAERAGDIAGYEERLRGGGEAYQRDVLGAMGQYQQAMRGGMGETRAGQLGQLDLARQGIMGATGGLGGMGMAALGQAQGLAGSPMGVDVTQDPGYQFRLQEGQRALGSSAAARGMSQSGAAMKEMGRFSQGLASQEYGAAYNRAAGLRQERLGVLGQLGQLGAGALGQQAVGMGQLGVTGAGLTPDYARSAVNMAGGYVDPRTAMMSPTAGWQDRGGNIARTMSAQQAMYGGTINLGAQAIGQNTQAQSAIQQNLGNIGAQQATSGFNTMMGLGQLGASLYGAGAFGGGAAAGGAASGLGNISSMNIGFNPTTLGF